MNIFEGGRRVYKAIVAIPIVAGILGFDNVPLSERLQNLALWLVFLGVFTWAVGWIVRGFMRLSATKLENCSIVDKSNFSCNGLERKDGKFVNTSAIGWRRLSSSKVSASVARYWGNGWVDDAILNLHDHEWMGIVYLLVILGGAFMVILAI